jgi:fucose permease
MTDSEVLIPAMIASTLVFGLTTVLPASVRGALARRLGRDENRLGGLLATFQFTLAPMLLAAGLAVDRWGAQGVIIIGSLGTALGLSVLAVSRTSGQVLAALVLLGVGVAGVGMGGSVLMPQAFFPRHPVAGTAIGMLFFTLGALAAPGLGQRLVGRWGLRQGLLLLALLTLVPGVTAALTPWPEQVQPPIDLGPALKHPVLWLAGLLLLLYVPVEALLASWSTRFLVEMGHVPSVASTLTSGFWLSFLATRLGTGLFLGEYQLVIADPEPWLVMTLAVLAAILLGNLVGTVRLGNASLGLILVGASLGPMFPALLGMMFRLYPRELWGTAGGVVWALGMLGGLILPPLFRGRVERQGIRNALRVPMVLSLVTAFGALVLALLNQVEWR